MKIGYGIAITATDTVVFFFRIVFGACVWYVLHRLNFIPLLLLLISLHLLSFDPFNSRLFCISFAFLTLEILVGICDIYVYEMILKKPPPTSFFIFFPFLLLYSLFSSCVLFVFFLLGPVCRLSPAKMGKKWMKTYVRECMCATQAISLETKWSWERTTYDMMPLKEQAKEYSRWTHECVTGYRTSRMDESCFFSRYVNYATNFHVNEASVWQPQHTELLNAHLYYFFLSLASLLNRVNTYVYVYFV